uniref:Uncharacterized protein AlNc14C11G1326 n=1 Tax=Albugo laibachii Nc14 TaxID=890382 RepID=F0W2U6_9STRA|nr:conserved hypothetical protein [Albugo laibachii Nc14]|eukprot:CCA15382.1 conserved hypothetical protein [Albugo laibachii Nc14]
MESAEAWAHEVFAPVILTCTTPEVERLALKNHMCFTDILNAFASLSNLQTSVRSVNNTLQLQSFRFRFLAAKEFDTVSVSDATQVLNQAISRHNPLGFQSSSTETAKGGACYQEGSEIVNLDLPHVSCAEDVPKYLKSIGVPMECDGGEANMDSILPWYQAFKRVFMDTFRCEDFSLLTQPIAMLLVVSSSESNPRHSFEELGSIKNLPPIFLQGLYDPNISKYHLVVHDCREAEGTSIDPDAIYQNLRLPNAYGSVLRFNSSRAFSEGIDTKDSIVPLGSRASNRLGSQSLGFQGIDITGRALTKEDTVILNAFVHKFGLQFVLPNLEARIFQLNEVVSSMKKGVKNVFKSWLRKPKELSSRTASFTSSLGSNGGKSISDPTLAGRNVTYRFDSIEAQTRLLADTAFMLGDYDLALQTYRLVRDDYKSDRSVFHCANANEMIALCLLLSKGSPMQTTNALEAAWTIYSKAPLNPIVSRLAVRNAIIAGEMYHALSHSGLMTDYMDSASASLIRGSAMEQGICSAVLTERAAYCDIQMRLPRFRKYGFRMVMAGHIYDSLGHCAHAARCYTLARGIYDSSGWHQVEDHINFTLAQQANRLHDPLASIMLFLKLIGTGRNSASQQEALLYEFGHIVKEFLANPHAIADDFTYTEVQVDSHSDGVKRLVVKELCMPEIEDKSTVVFAPLNATGIDRQVDGNALERGEWERIEQFHSQETRAHYAALEAIAEKNPLSRFPAVYSSVSGTKNIWLVARAAEEASNALQSRSKRHAISVQKPDTYAVGEMMYVEFVMKNPLSCAVSVEDIHVFGSMEIEVANTLKAVHEFPEWHTKTPHVQVNTTHIQLLPCSEKSVRLSLCPTTEGLLKISGVRWSICGGDVNGEHTFSLPGPLLHDTRANRETRARAPNLSLFARATSSMAWLGVKIDHSQNKTFFVGQIFSLEVSLNNAGNATLANLQMLSPDVVACVELDGQVAPFIGSSGQLIDLRAIILRPGEQRHVKLWARAREPGKRPVRLLFRYSSDGVDCYRSVRLKLNLTFVPSVRVSYSVRPSVTRSGEYILGITVLNECIPTGYAPGKHMISIDQFVCCSKRWKLEKLAELEELQIDCQEACTMYFCVKETKQSVTFDACLRDGETYAFPMEQFLFLDNAKNMEAEYRLAMQHADDENSGRGAGFRSIQSVRRENKAVQIPISEQRNLQVDRCQPCLEESLASSADIDAHFVLLWSIPQSTGEGDHIFGQENIVSARIRSNWEPRMNPLTMTLAYSERIELKAEGGGFFAQVDVDVVIRSNLMSSHPPITFLFRALQDTTSTGEKRSHPRFHWAGLTRKLVTQCASGAQIIVPLKACFTTAGEYNLNQIQLVLYSTDMTTSHVVTTSTEYLISVKLPAALYSRNTSSQSQ